MSIGSCEGGWLPRTVPLIATVGSSTAVRTPAIGTLAGAAWIVQPPAAGAFSPMTLWPVSSTGTEIAVAPAVPNACGTTCVPFGSTRTTDQVDAEVALHLGVPAGRHQAVMCPSPRPSTLPGSSARASRRGSTAP
jgi:hypothetical protein